VAPLGATAVAPVERLEEALGGKRLLLVMDNCEHLVAAVAELVDRLLGRCPALRVLATSREPLGLPGEVLHPVGPLAMPAEDVAPAEAARYPAVRLFADRGAAARPGFAVDEATVAPVLRICRALDGIPLALELAAARLRALSPEQIAGRLDDRFRLLADGSRPALPRHQTLRAVVDWSWDLLDDSERVLLRRLAVFAGGATLEAVERVCADPGPGLGGLARDDVLYLLAALVDKSLVVAGEDGEAGEVRYRLLETVRAYGQERRRQAGEDEALHRAHAAYFLDLAERADPRLRGHDQLGWIARLSAERDNLHTALRWAVDTPDATMALRLVVALGWYWLLRSARAEATGWAAQVQPLASSREVPPALRAQLLAYRSLLTISGGLQFGQALEAADRRWRSWPGCRRTSRDGSTPWSCSSPSSWRCSATRTPTRSPTCAGCTTIPIRGCARPGTCSPAGCWSTSARRRRRRRSCASGSPASASCRNAGGSARRCSRSPS
jgi:predicted ATPase